MTVHIETCDWSRPGVDPYTGSLAEALWSYEHIGIMARYRLWMRMRNGRGADDLCEITKTGIASRRFKYISGPNDMFFGKNKSCSFVSRAKWPDGHVEPSRVWFEGRYGVGISDICGNPWWCEREYVPGRDDAKCIDGDACTVPDGSTAGLLVPAALAWVIARRMTGRKDGVK